VVFYYLLHSSYFLLPFMLTDLDLQTFITQHGITATLLYPGVPTPTVPDAAKALGVDSAQIIKSLVFLFEDIPHLLIAAGEARIDYKKLSEAAGLSRKGIRMATPEEALTLSGYEVGAMPPFGHKEAFMTFIDANSVHSGYGIYYGGGGSKSALLGFSLSTLLDITRARVAPLT
jgi:prolyl-tRNA editing enzyme YbaK/EbsC (Cys-tRNA(Pro) deacylase)